MKIKNGFVSNSSSSSFIVFGKNPKEAKEYNDTHLSDSIFKRINSFKELRVLELPLVGYGTTEFGWDFEQYYSLADKLNFVAIQLIDTYGNSENRQRVNLFERAIEEVMGKNIVVRYDYNSILPSGLTRNYNMYVDHQSHLCEGENTELFESIEAMKEFLFDNDSYIQGGNDNDDYSNHSEYMESLEKKYGIDKVKKDYPEYYEENR